MTWQKKKKSHLLKNQHLSYVAMPIPQVNILSDSTQDFLEESELLK